MPDYSLRLFVCISLLTLILFSPGCTNTSQTKNSNSASISPSQNTNANVNIQPQLNKQAGAPEGYIDDVTGEAIVGGKLTVSGWSADREEGAPVKRVEILVDNNVVAQATLGKPRNDVLKVSNRPDWLRSGWEATISLEDVLPGAHTITAIAYDSTGTGGLLNGTRNIGVVAKQ